MTKVLLYPEFSEVDGGDGGVGRVYRMQKKWLPEFGITLVDRIEEADVVACHIEIPDNWLKMYPEKKYVAHIHGLYWEGYDWLKWTESANQKVMEAIRVADAVTAPSEWVAQTIRRATCRQVDVVYHGIEPSEWNSQDISGDVARYVLFDKTRVDPICEVDSLIEVASLLPDMRFVSTAGSSDLDNLLCLPKQPYEAAANLTRNAWIYLATTRETFGLSIVQAMASGVPIVGYNWGGQAEFCDDTNSILVDPGDTVALMHALYSVWHDDDLRARMGVAARMRATQPDLLARTVCEQYSLIYKGLYPDLRKRVSVIIPSYNLGEYLPNAVSSVVTQLGPDDELIIVDDCSTDGSREIVEEYAKHLDNVRVIQTPSNLYLSGARNYGIARSSGRYILPLDADDMLAPGALDTLAGELDKDRHIHIAYGSVMFIEADGREWHSGWPMQFRQEWQSNQRNLLPYSSMYRRSVWENLGGYRSHHRTAEDADFWTRASRYGYRPRMVTQADTLIYRNRPDSMSRSVPMHDWAAWFSPKLPAGASTDEQLPVPTLHPPVVSVIIPVGKGHEKYVETALDSLEAQSFLQWEAIVVNDTGNESRLHLPTWVRTIRTNSVGTTGARNTGVQAAHGRLIVPLDADDYLQPDALQIFYDAYLSMPVEQRRRTILYSDFWEDPESAGEYRRYFSKDYAPETLTTKGAQHSVTTLYHKSIWEDVGGYPDVVGWEDWGFQLACAEKGYCSRRIAAPLFTYRKHTGQRREENMVSFDLSKDSIMQRFGKYWEGETLMACGCQSGSASTIFVDGSAPQYSDPNRQQDALLISYVGEKQADFTIRGRSGVNYSFSKGDVKWVLNEDVDKLLGDKDFQKANVGPEILARSSGDQPVLAAVGR